MIIIIRLFFCALVAAITWLSLASDPAPASDGMALTRWLSNLLFQTPQWADKIGHFLAYSALGFSAAAARFVRLSRIWVPFGLLCAYGFLLEWVQFSGGVRHGDMLDGVANSAGALAGFIGFFTLALAISRLARNNRAQ